jgi:xylan 1,4-beta-xylosidase
MGRQTLLEPIEWTEDGWYKIPDGMKTDEPIKRPARASSDAVFTLNDSFDGNTLKPQWKFFGGYDTSRFSMDGNGIDIKAKGHSIGECSPLLCIPSDHSYTAQVEMFIEGEAIGGLVLFYNDRASTGLLADKENILANLRGWQFVTERKVIKNHVFLRLKNINNTVDMFYSTDGEKWKKIENSIEVTGYNHNVLGGFLSLRLGLCSIGDGKVKFKNFEYKPIK